MSSAQPQPDLSAEDIQFFRGILHDLVERGADLAKRLHEQVTTPAAAGPDATPTPITPTPITPATIAAFDQIARAVRRTILLARKIAEPGPVQSAGPDRTAARKRIIRVVEDAIQHRAKDQDSANAELLERLDSADLEEELTNRSIKEIITDIIRDLGMAHMPGTHPWKRRTPDDIAILCARAAGPPPIAANLEPIRQGHPSPPPVKRSTG